MKIIAVGMNYRAHIRELGDPIPQEPVIFMKPSSAILNNHETFVIPDFSKEIHYEAELVVKISSSGKSIGEQSARGHYDEITVGIDFTARDMQRTLRAKGNPWELCKAFDHSAAIGEFVNTEHLKDRENIEFGLRINGKEVQHGFSSDMLFDFDTIIAYVSRFITLNEGDLIYTGTPSGIGPVSNGDLLEGYLQGTKVLDILIQ
ncbi:MAG: fumarylacetoacetate hydrolase family protein [Prolixibacteraceae bacterium]|jgi:2-keto-4-pentenoate hydratase/2-oxohepta-3-ene-1,7-dioic acid hydratase in catechol pathway|nr:fumarylacetoacetate hydrolase family protein [Prolixibacteraceae bacterium]